MVEPVADPLSNSGLQRVVVEHGGEDEARELGFAARDVLRFLADSGPHRIDGAHPLSDSDVALGHRILPGLE